MTNKILAFLKKQPHRDVREITDETGVVQFNVVTFSVEFNGTSHVIESGETLKNVAEGYDVSKMYFYL